MEITYAFDLFVGLTPTEITNLGNCGWEYGLLWISIVVSRVLSYVGITECWY